MSRVIWLLGQRGWPPLNTEGLLRQVGESAWPHHAAQPGARTHSQNPGSSQLLFCIALELCKKMADSEGWTKPAAAAAKSLQSCPTLCDPIDGSPPGSPNPGILQARTLEWVAISFNAWKWNVKVKSLSRARLFMIPWTAAHQALLPMGFSRQVYWSGVPLPSPTKPASYRKMQVCICLQGRELVSKWMCRSDKRIDFNSP